MRMQPMSYKSYVWPFNPETVQIEYGRNIKEIKLPFTGSVLQDMGCNKRSVIGKGEFIGSTCMTEFSRLSGVFAEEGSGTLRMPGIAPFTAAFSVLKMVGKAQPDCVSYEFAFWEDNASASDGAAVTDTGIYVCAGGESLWSVANRFGTTVDRLKALNPMIQWPNDLEAGRKVVLP
jgi:hypothetical protein